MPVGDATEVTDQQVISQLGLPCLTDGFPSCLCPGFQKCLWKRDPCFASSIVCISLPFLPQGSGKGSVLKPWVSLFIWYNEAETVVRISIHKWQLPYNQIVRVRCTQSSSHFRAAKDTCIDMVRSCTNTSNFSTPNLKPKCLFNITPLQINRFASGVLSSTYNNIYPANGPVTFIRRAETCNELKDNSVTISTGYLSRSNFV